MLRKLYLLAAWLFVSQQAAAQNNVPAFHFPFSGQPSSLSEKQKKLADSLYSVLPEGEKLRLDLLDAEEEQLTQAERAQTSYQRAALLLQHYRQSGIGSKTYCAAMVPFDMPNVVRTNDLTRASALSMARKSQTHILLTKQGNPATSTPAVNIETGFDEPMQTFDFEAGRDMCISLASGTSICIPANSLVQANGQSPACTQLTLRVTEYLDLEAMALKAMTTTSSGKKLETGGMWYIDVVCNGQRLVMKAGKKYTISVAVKGSVKDMRVFTGQIKNGLLNWKAETDDRVLGAGTANDVPIDSSQYMNYEVEYSGESMMNMDGMYTLELNDFGWINCDAFSDAPAVTNLLVTGEIDKTSNVMLVYGKRQSVLPGYLCEDGKSVVFSNVATDETAMLVVFKKTDDKGGIKKYTRLVLPGQDKNVSVSLTASTAPDLRNEIKGRLSDL